MNWYNLHKTANAKGIISFDFDDTLTKPEYSEEDGIWVSSGPNLETIAEMNKFHKEGYTVIIVTSRYDKDMEEVRNFVQKYSLPVSGIYNTNGELKGPMLKELGVMKHFDDCPDEIETAEQYNVSVERVWHPLDVEMNNEANE